MNYVIWPLIQIGLVVTLIRGLGSVCDLSGAKDLGIHAGATRTDAGRTMGITAANRRRLEVADQGRLHS